MGDVSDHGSDDRCGEEFLDDAEEFVEGDDADAGPPVRAIDRFSRTAVGGMLAAGMLGLREVFEPERDDRPAIVEDWSGAPPFGDRILMRLDPENPQDSIVVVRRRDD